MKTNSIINQGYLIFYINIFLKYEGLLFSPLAFESLRHMSWYLNNKEDLFVLILNIPSCLLCMIRVVGEGLEL